MTLVGASVFERLPRVVSSQGVGPNDGWEVVAEFPGTKLPNGDAHVVFVVWATVGSIQGTQFGSEAICEVALARHDEVPVFGDTLMRFSLSDATLRSSNRGLPYFVVRAHTVEGAGRGSWNNAWNLQMRARIFRNGDPVGSVNAAFHVGSIAFLCFDVDALGSANYEVAYYGPSGGSVNNIEPEGFHSFAQTTPTNIANGAWVAFSAVSYDPRSAAGAPLYQTVAMPDGSFGPSNVPIIGENTASGSGGGRMGILPHGKTDPLGKYVRYQHGGFRLFGAVDGVTAVGLRGFDWHANTNARSVLQSWELFCVKASALGSLGSLKFDAGEAGFDPIYNDWNYAAAPGLIAHEPVEWTRSFAADYVVIANAMFDQGPTGFERVGAYGLAIGNAAQVIEEASQWPRQTVYTGDITEGVHNHTGWMWRAMQASAAQLRFFALQDVEEFALNKQLNGKDFTALGWHWETAPVFDPFQPALPITVVVVPPYEAPDVSLVPALPIAPNDTRSEVVETERNAFATDAGYVLRWSKFLKARRRFRFVWGPLTLTQRDTLLDFFHAQPKRVFKWQPPDETAPLLFGLVGQAQSDDIDGVLHAVTADALQLVYAEPLP